jgi:hypothetical protein
MVLDHVAGLAVDGVVPPETLTTGPQDQSRRAFQRAVVGDARERGLARDRWSGSANAFLRAAALVPAGLGVLYANAAGGLDTGTIGAGPVTWVVLASAIKLFGDQRDTPAGAEAAARWLGVRDYLTSSGSSSSARAAPLRRPAAGAGRAGGRAQRGRGRGRMETRWRPGPTGMGSWRRARGWLGSWPIRGGSGQVGGGGGCRARPGGGGRGGSAACRAAAAGGADAWLPVPGGIGRWIGVRVHGGRGPGQAAGPREPAVR